MYAEHIFVVTGGAAETKPLLIQRLASDILNYHSLISRTVWKEKKQSGGSQEREMIQISKESVVSGRC